MGKFFSNNDCGNDCTWIILILILLFCCGGCEGNGGCGFGGNGNNCCWIIILILILCNCCGGGNDCNNQVGCGC